jgi:ketosteroid isomerase-like protein
MDRTRSSSQVLDDLVAATNSHDLDTLVGCFAPDYVLTDPAHPSRSFAGAAQVRRNWSAFFAAVPDIRMEVEQHTITTGGFWLEARQAGTRLDGVALDTWVVYLATVTSGRISSARMHVTPVERDGPGVDAVIGAMTGTSPSKQAREQARAPSGPGLEQEATS